jgi:hypothetical protein
MFDQRAVTGVIVPVRRTGIGRDLRRFVRFVLDNRLDAIQAAKAWTGDERWTFALAWRRECFSKCEVSHILIDPIGAGYPGG